MSVAEPTPKTPLRNTAFVPTNWDLVVAAGEEESADTAKALAKLCRTYWYPLYAYVRRKGHSVHDAEDLTQGFFEQLMRRESIRQVRGEGKFRSFLLAALEHFLAAEWNRARRVKRGGNTSVISIEDLSPETRYQIEPLDERTARQIYDRRWAMTVLEQAMERLRQECVAAEKEFFYGELKGTLSGDRLTGSYAEIGARLNLSEGAVKVAVHRLRQRYAELIREEVAQTVNDPSHLDEEINHLLAALSP